MTEQAVRSFQMLAQLSIGRMITQSDVFPKNEQSIVLWRSQCMVYYFSSGDQQFSALVVICCQFTGTYL